MNNAAMVLGWVGIVFAVLLIQPLIIYCLWDDTLVKFFDIKDVTFMDSVWISIICSCMFKGSYSVSKS